MGGDEITLFYILYIDIIVLHLVVLVIGEIINPKFEELRLANLLQNFPNVRQPLPYSDIPLHNFGFLRCLFL